ncbi:MAG: hypothetical protein HZC42_12120 [Candidatus Eisenbacteria bacterium]|nr:hypothetical protein [Candidatus Eisenbacteria bacterium]
MGVSGYIVLARVRGAALPLCCALALAGCAAHHPRPRPEPPHVPIESRPTPQPPPADTVRAAPQPPPTLLPKPTLLELAVSDTSAAGAMLRRCAGRRLLPEQESTWDATASLLAQARAALLRGDVARGRSLARDAKQLASSLGCR